MGFLQRFFRNVFREDETPTGASSFEQLSEDELERTWGSRATATSADRRRAAVLRPPGRAHARAIGTITTATRRTTRACRC